ncbi:ExeA family protein [Motiliproteus sp. SC1-56]|uniref:ExeA family protein n=1 Tax=Motiliproteus sp. SC1-56 TaxID=2799565 RepID=UPI001A8CF197|nr:AAA family ATPase [Motiliproteus sp. SC1-56]
MYEQHFGLRELPFTLTPNTQFFLNLPTHQEALNLILVALGNGDGFVKIVGEVGTGKTLLCRKVLGALDEACYVSAYIPNPALNPEDFRSNFARELGLTLTPGETGFALLERINQRLIELAGEGRQVVLMVDEAQTMPEETLESLRLLTNLETESRKLFQVVLFGQPELDTLLARPSLRQLHQRITFSYRLRTLDRSGTGHYLQHRLGAAGYNGLPLFTAAASRLVYRASSGTPRLINILAHKAMMAAYGKGERSVAPARVRAAVADTEGLRLPLHSRPWVRYPAALGALLLAGLSAFWFSGTSL